MRIVFMGSPEFAVPSLKLLQSSGFDVVGVVTQPDRPLGRGRIVTPTPVKRAALQSDLVVYQPPTLKSAEALSWFHALAPDAIVVVAFGQILRRSVLNVPRLGCVNVHPSLLPTLRGAAPIQAAIRDGLPETGVTIMLMNERLDAGPILSQKSFPILPGDTTSTLSERLAQAGAVLLVETLIQVERGAITSTPQDESKATYCTPLRKEDAEVNWSLPAVEIARRCRAQTPWPGCQTTWNGRLIRLVSVEPEPNWAGPEAPGTVVVVPGAESAGPRIAVATGAGALVLHELQIAGKKPLGAAEFVRGQPRLINSTLEASIGTERARS